MSKRIEFQVSDELFAGMEKARGDVSRARWLTRAVEYYLIREWKPGDGPPVGAPATRQEAAGSTPANRASLSLRDTWAR